MKRGKKTIETDVSFPAFDVWVVYSSLELPEIIRNIPNYVKDLKVTGDGSVGTTYDIWNLPGSPFDWYKEKVTRLDQQELIKDVDVIQGGVLNFGFTFFRTKFEIVSKDANQTCTVKSSVLYEIEDKFADNEKMASAEDLAEIALAVEEYLRKKKAGGGSVLDTGLGTGDGSAPKFNTVGLPE